MTNHSNFTRRLVKLAVRQRTLSDPEPPWPPDPGPEPPLPDPHPPGPVPPTEPIPPPTPPEPRPVPPDKLPPLVPPIIISRTVLPRRRVCQPAESMR